METNSTVSSFSPTLPVYLKFDDISYDVKIPAAKRREPPTTKRLLSNISGAIPPKQLLAIMGSSGAGKSTFLNAISNRITITEGCVSWNSNPLNREFARRSAFVQQEDIFFPYLTVQEHMDYQAKLRLPESIKKDKKNEIVETLIQRLGLDKCRNAPIGGGGSRTRGISGGERKRLSIASEIITNPSVLFLDEPTSGLDSYMAASVVSLMKELADSGRTVAATIHQPSADVFTQFDWLLLLSEGRIAYHGPRALVVDYFSHIGHSCPLDENPADYLIRLLALPYGDEEKKDKVNDIIQKWNDGAGSIFGIPSSLDELPKEEELTDTIERLRSKEIDAVEEMVANLQEGYAVSFGMQFIVLSNRSLLNQGRNPMLTLVRLLQVLVVGLIFGLLYLRLDLNQNAVQNKAGACFFILMNQSITATMGVQMTFPSEKPIAFREYEAGSYSILAYYLAKITVDIPFQIVFPTIFTVFVYFMIGLNDDATAFFASLLMILMVTNTCTSIGYLISAGASNVSQALALSSVIIMPMTMFAGFSINIEEIPSFWIWMEWISFLKWGFSGLIYAVFGFNHPDFPDCFSNSCFKTGMEVVRYFAIPSDEFQGYWANVVALGIMIIFYRSLGGFILYRKANHSKLNG